MTKLNDYEQLIVEATGCQPEEAKSIEAIMRDDILHSTLDWLNKEQFFKAAKEAHELYLYINSEEGKAYLASIEREFLNS